MKHFNKSILIVFLLFASEIKAQDPHFSQYYASPLFLNPAMMGIIDGNARVIFNHRGQWLPIQKSYKSFGFSADLPVSKRWGVGIGIKDQYAGTAFYNYLNAIAGASYRIPVNTSETKNIVFGGQLGAIQRTYDPEKATWGNQYIPGAGFDPSMSSGENFTQRENKMTADINLGVMFFDGNTNKKITLFGGIAAYHINNPNTALSGEKSGQGVRLVTNAGLRIKVRRSLDLIPNVIYMNQKTANNMILGATAYYNLNQKETDLIFGAQYRLKESITPYAGVQYKNFTLGLSYDFNLNELSQIQQRKGSYELALTYIVRKTDYVKRFVCPRL